MAQQIVRSPLLVPHCADADLIYVPFNLQWAKCHWAEDIYDIVQNFTDNLENWLPLLHDKPHFMAISFVAIHQAEMMNISRFIEAGISFLTIEGDGSPAFVEVPYPSHYHDHAGLPHNRFMQAALWNKSRLAFQCFRTHHGDDVLNIRQQLWEACSIAQESCTHISPDTAKDGEVNEQTAEWAEGFFQQASQAWYCMQPAGDTPTRRSTFDCLLAGSIPVLFDLESLQHFPWADVIEPASLALLVNESDINILFSDILPGISHQQRDQMLHRIAEVSHVYQYSLQPSSHRILWSRVGQIEGWDDAFTFAIKSLIRNLQKRGILTKG